MRGQARFSRVAPVDMPPGGNVGFNGNAKICSGFGRCHVSDKFKGDRILRQTGTCPRYAGEEKSGDADLGWTIH
jgi:hypothetical protein